jgi:hypothetical protein
LIGPRTAIRLNPSPAGAVQRANPQAHLFGTEGRVGHFQRDAAHVLVGEEIVTGELQAVQGALRVEEKGIAAPAGEDAVVTGLCHPCLRPRRDRHPLDDDLPVVTCPSGLRALNARSVAVCAPPSEDVKRTRYAISATASPLVSILSS